MTPEEYLNQLIDIDKEIRCLDHGRRRLLNTSIKATQWKHDKSFSHDISRPNEDAVTKLEEYNESISEKQKDMIHLVGTISREIDAVDVRNFRILLTYRYIYGLNMVQIAEHMHYSPRHCRNIHRNALKEFKNVHDDKDWV